MTELIIKKTKQDISGTWFGHNETIPKGTRVTNACASKPHGPQEYLTAGNYFIDDLAWLPVHESGVKKHGFIHDATYYGIRLNEAQVEDLNTVKPQMYNHAFDIAFEVLSETEDGEDVTPAMFRAALQNKMDDMDSNGDLHWQECIGCPFDTFKCE